MPCFKLKNLPSILPLLRRIINFKKMKQSKRENLTRSLFFKLVHSENALWKAKFETQLNWERVLYQDVEEDNSRKKEVEAKKSSNVMNLIGYWENFNFFSLAFSISSVFFEMRSSLDLVPPLYVCFLQILVRSRI